MTSDRTPHEWTLAICEAAASPTPKEALQDLECELDASLDIAECELGHMRYALKSVRRRLEALS